MSDAMDTLGTILKPGQGRDAIHVATLQVQADTDLWPGQKVEIKDGLARVGKKPVGIVDPYLDGMVSRGEFFWVLLLPRTITSLRHVWSHPDVPDEMPIGKITKTKTAAKCSKEESEKWLREYAESRPNDLDYDEMMSVIAGRHDPNSDFFSENNGEAIRLDGKDAHGDIPDEFWDHIENVTGQVFPRAKYFTCAC